MIGLFDNRNTLFKRRQFLLTLAANYKYNDQAMEQLVLNIKNKSKIPFLKEILKRMEFVEIVEPVKLSAQEKKFISDFEQSVEWVNKHKTGKIKKTKSFQQLLNEL